VKGLRCLSWRTGRVSGFQQPDLPKMEWSACQVVLTDWGGRVVVGGSLPQISCGWQVTRAVRLAGWLVGCQRLLAGRLLRWLVGVSWPVNWLPACLLSLLVWLVNWSLGTEVVRWRVFSTAAASAVAPAARPAGFLQHSTRAAWVLPSCRARRVMQSAGELPRIRGKHETAFVGRQMSADLGPW